VKVRALLVLLPVLSVACYGDSYDVLLRRYARQIDQQEKQLGTLRARLSDKEREAARWQQKADEARQQWNQAAASVQKTRAAVQGLRTNLKTTQTLADAAESTATEQALLAHSADQHVAFFARDVYARRQLAATMPAVTMQDRYSEFFLSGLANASTRVHTAASEAQSQEARLRTRELEVREQEQQESAELDRLHQKQQAQWLKWQEANQRRLALEEEKSQMEQSAQALRVMVQELRDHRDHAKAARQGKVGDDRALASLRGTLPWPAQGRVTQSFGRQYSDELKQLLVSNGIKIEAGPVHNVRAVQPGKVLFASPFRQYGQLVIVQHRNGLAAV